MPFTSLCGCLITLPFSCCVAWTDESSHRSSVLTVVRIHISKLICLPEETIRHCRGKTRGISGRSVAPATQRAIDGVDDQHLRGAVGKPDRVANMWESVSCRIARPRRAGRSRGRAPRRVASGRNVCVWIARPMATPAVVAQQQRIGQRRPAQEHRALAGRETRPHTSPLNQAAKRCPRRPTEPVRRQREYCDDIGDMPQREGCHARQKSLFDGQRICQQQIANESRASCRARPAARRTRRLVLRAQPDTSSTPPARVSPEDASPATSAIVAVIAMRKAATMLLGSNAPQMTSSAISQTDAASL